MLGRPRLSLTRRLHGICHVGVHVPLCLPSCLTSLPVPVPVCPFAEDGVQLFSCPSPDKFGQYHCIDDHALCDSKLHCPNGEDEDPTICMFHKMVSVCVCVCVGGGGGHQDTQQGVKPWPLGYIVHPNYGQVKIVSLFLQMLTKFCTEPCHPGLSPITVLTLLSPSTVLTLLSPSTVLTLLSPNTVLTLLSPITVLTLLSPNTVLTLLSPDTVRPYSVVT